ncbi:MAG TPA: family 20 glycosylhydrolase, partial [Ignavibacteriaceae bacterium]|nr:family 20 glycosylhydrolase [Ignavibacteriaceae bacterium]
MAKKLFALLVLLVFLITPFVFPQNNLNIIPKPLKTELLQENFSLNNKTTILISSNSTELKKLAEFLNDAIKNSTGFELKIQSLKKQRINNSISFEIINDNGLEKEGYRLHVDKKGIKISANTETGLFYGVQTLLQLLPAEILSNKIIKDKDWKIPGVEITDKPEFKYRGMHLDVSRHFFPKEFVKKYIDLLAAYKLNYFHWHLTDDNGWRIEIKKYPLLTKISAWHVDRE